MAKVKEKYVNNDEYEEAMESYESEYEMEDVNVFTHDNIGKG